MEYRLLSEGGAYFWAASPRVQRQGRRGSRQNASQNAGQSAAELVHNRTAENGRVQERAVETEENVTLEQEEIQGMSMGM